MTEKREFRNTTDENWVSGSGVQTLGEGEVTPAFKHCNVILVSARSRKLNEIVGIHNLYMCPLWPTLWPGESKCRAGLSKFVSSTRLASSQELM